MDKIYEKRKSAALDLEKSISSLLSLGSTHLIDIYRQIRECHAQGDQRRISQIIDQLVEMFSNPSNPLHIRNGGLIGLAGTAIALGVDIAPYMEKFVDPLLVCFTDPENRIRYFSAECLYNIAKVSKGEILVYFNPIFDALSKVSTYTVVLDALTYQPSPACRRLRVICQEWRRASRSPAQGHSCRVCLRLHPPIRRNREDS